MPVSSDYPDGTNRFNGKIDPVQIDLGDDNHEHLIDPDEIIRIAMARQQTQRPSWPPGGHAIEISGRRAHPAPDPSEQAERSGPDLLCARDLSAACAFVEVQEKLSKTRIGLSQLPPDVAEGPPPELAPDHHDVRERASWRASPRSPELGRHITTALSAGAKARRGAGQSVGVAVMETSRAVASRTRTPAPLTHLQLDHTSSWP
jgi:hypothetical protein